MNIGDFDLKQAQIADKKEKKKFLSFSLCLGVHIIVNSLYIIIYHLHTKFGYKIKYYLEEKLHAQVQSGN